VQAPIDLFARQQQQMQEQAAANERAYRDNVSRLTEMFLSFGLSVIQVAESSRHDAALAEARGLAGHRWNQVLSMEQQIVREEQQLAARPKKRPSEVGDDLLPDRTIAERERAWEEQTKHMHAAHAELRKLAETERRELESYVAKPISRR
jgi:hypothetical protein